MKSEDFCFPHITFLSMDSRIMATATMATAAGAAALLYYTLNKKLQSSPTTGDEDEENGTGIQVHAPLGIERVSHRLIQAPATWLETISTLSETLRFTYSETLGKWPIGDLAFGISFLLKRQCCENRARGAQSEPVIAPMRRGRARSVERRWGAPGSPWSAWVVCQMWGNSNSSIKFDKKRTQYKQRLRQAINYANKKFNGQLKMAAPSGLNGVVCCRGGVDLGRKWIDLASAPFKYSSANLGLRDLELKYQIVFGYVGYGQTLQGNLQVGREFGGSDSILLKGPEIAAELRYLLYLLTHRWHFSKKPFPKFLEETGHSQEDVILQEPKAGDTLTAVTGAVVPFHHSVVCEGGVINLVLGYAHGGMVAAARWIAKLSTSCLLTSLAKHPDYKLKIIGHSLGGGTAALLTYILRETHELSTATCVAFAPAACMTWELAESGNECITSVINGADLVPTFSAASVDDLRAEVTASAWVNDLRNQIERTRILSTVYRSASALGSRLPSMASAKAKVAGAGAILRPVSNRTQVVMKRAQSMAQAAWSRPALRSWSCIGPRRRVTAAEMSCNVTEDPSESSVSQRDVSEEPLIETIEETTSLVENLTLPASSPDGRDKHKIIDFTINTEVEDYDDIMDPAKFEDQMTEVELWQQIERELYKHSESDEESGTIKEIREEEEAAIAEVSDPQSQASVPNTKEVHRFFPAGKIMHIVTLVSDESERERDCDVSSSDSDSSPEENTEVAIFLTPRSLYSKLRLSQTMIAEHFMPVYRREIEKLIRVLEKGGVSDTHSRVEEAR
ncbi:hypothetical protein SASPL_120575 [Salvia splendens]|uniref:Sn1-specific diacylglycerol lipase alpha n=1 Tax=Salvia splendens TaxID=180675 RepID=A0A8X8XT92_SALSN|nr:hypothetical protein SASPL_120575 [Salvia splendens]